MIGEVVTERDGEKRKFVVRSLDESNDEYVLELHPDEGFGPPVSVKRNQIRNFYKVRAAASHRQPTEAETVSWKKIGRFFDKQAGRKTPLPRAVLTPEEVFGGKAAEVAAQIASNPVAMEAHALDLLPISPEVAAALEDIASGPSKAEDVERITDAEAKRLGHKS